MKKTLLITCIGLLSSLSFAQNPCGIGSTSGFSDSGSHGVDGFHTYPSTTFHPLGDNININYQALDNPNRFNISGEAFWSSGWVGFSSCPGPWGGSISNGSSNGNLTLSSGVCCLNFFVETVVNTGCTGLTDAWSAGISISGSQPCELPVDLVGFECKSQGLTNVLSWNTSSELNFSHFEIERAGRDMDFSSIGIVNSNNQPSNYSFTDANLTNSEYVYRLKLVDLDGTFEYSHHIQA